MEKRTVEFDSAESRISANLYLPEAHVAGAPAILLCHGFAGVKEMLLPAFAERFAEAGYVAMTFDYRGFGGSEGDPGRLEPVLQIEDIQHAITFLAQCSAVDPNRIALWGTSFGGANVLMVASEDMRVKAISVQLAFADGERVITSAMSQDEKSKLLDTLAKLKLKKEKTGKDMMVPIIKVLSDEQSKLFYQQNVERYPALKAKIPFLTIAEVLQYKPINVVAQIKVPMLIVAAVDDDVNPVSESHALFAAANEPKALLELEGVTHYEVYDGSAFEQVVNKQLDWFKHHL